MSTKMSNIKKVKFIIYGIQSNIIRYKRKQENMAINENNQ